MNTPTPTPTPRTDAAWASSFEPCEYRAAHTARTMRDECERLEIELTALTAERDQLRAEVNEAHAATHHWCNRAELAEAELATERARLDWVFRNCKVIADGYAIHDREDLGVAMKEGA